RNGCRHPRCQTFFNMRIALFIFNLALLGISCKAQTTSNHMSHQTSNPLLCDTATGICEMPGFNRPAPVSTIEAGTKPLKVIYFTDPICSSCWGIEPQLRKLKLEYGGSVDIDYRMGGLLPDWSYN